MPTTVRERPAEADDRRPLIDPTLATVTRAGGELQLGWDPERAVLVRPPHGLNATELAVLLKLTDGTRNCAELADAAGVLTAELVELFGVLAGAGLLGWTAPSQRVSAVHVHGQGPLSDAIWQGLAVGGAAPTRSYRRFDIGSGCPQLVVLADDLVTDPCLISELVSSHVNHLSVRLRDGIGLVGPLVLPGRTSCLRCADLHRSDQDPEWPMVAAQLLGRVGHGSAASVRATTGFALGQIELLLDVGSRRRAAPRTINATIDVDPRQAELRRRVWSPHPRCGCGAHR